MLSRVAVVKAPRTHNRRRVTGSSGRRREGRESEPQRPNMSRRVFTSAVLLLLFVLCCDRGATTAQVEKATDASTPSGSALTGAIAAEGSASGGVERPQQVDLFVPQTTQVLQKTGTGSSGRDSFVSPSLVSAGGVIAAFAEGRINAKNTPPTESTKPSSDVVAEYIDSAWEWSTLVEKVKEEGWRARTVLGKAEGNESFDVVRHPTTTMKGNKVFLLVGSTALSDVNESWKEGSLEIKLVVGEVTNPTDSEQSKRIEWGEIKSPLNGSTIAAHKGNLKEFAASGGSGVLMEDGTLVFSLMAVNEKNDGVYSMIIYSKDNGSTWALSEDMSPANCTDPRITEWEGSLLMIVDCENDQRVYESRDMGKTWTEAIGTLPGVWVNSQSEDYPEVFLHVDALITATIEGRKVMLYIQRGYASVEKEATALYLWVTDNNRSFFVGPVGMDDAAADWELASSLLHSDGNLHLLQRRGSGEHSAISLSRLTEELSTINSVLKTWAQNDAFFSNLSIPTAGLVAVLSNASASGDTWNDEYLCLNATVKNATKVKDGFQLTEPDSRAIWPVNTRGDNVRHISLSHNFTLVASVTIEGAPSEKTLLTAVLGDTEPPYIMRLSYTADNKWETMLKDEEKTTKSGTWKAGKEYQVALMLQGKKRSVYVDGELLGEEEVPLTGETPLEPFGFCFGACGEDDDGEESSPEEIGKKPSVTVTNVFLYNRPLNSTEMIAIKDRKPVPKRAPEPQVKIAPIPIAPTVSAVPGPRELPAAPGRTTVGTTANTQHAPAGRLTSAGNEGTAREKGDGGANGDAGSAYGRELLPLLLLLGLWGLATA
ncbi:putative trans-sialidase, Group II [Trypanosoma cruzi]|uniref:Trans-sialidase, putative n=2 Tax=Trypanosoma cruzi TaxID=5693 RepID=Q4CZA1_TRYCC|nr:trans-sialidase, putative [Trypanosoma cruzi]EAN85603.1 trans-sialidase, putative [Trypanosoma cruzi]PWV14136.1 putative trans-sialidase, Group II [Trypanosoma cruzi]RNC34654.1 trans-sialidase-like protein [Trypanosoma cruzi]|eukprot:XP_807454.1 trans-sialidase [Trypanosoma cruzi strain CL Brener]